MARRPANRCLCLDVGDRRVGVAAGSSEAGIARPIEVITRAPGAGDAPLLKRLRELVKREEAGTIVVGDPLNMDGTAGERAGISRRFAALLRGAIRQVRVEVHDERLSSFAADE
jgi:putative holliday junction resolvase